MGRTPGLVKDRSLGDIIAGIRRPHIPQDTSWYKVGSTQVQGVSFAGSWANVVGGSFSDASWFLTDDGRIKLRGHVTGGSPGDVIFNIPEGYRPEFSETHIIASDENGLYLEGINWRTFEVGDIGVGDE